MRHSFLSLFLLLMIASGCSSPAVPTTKPGLLELSPTVTPTLTEFPSETSTLEAAYPYPAPNDSFGMDMATAYPAGYQTPTPWPTFTPAPTVPPTPFTPTPTRGPLEKPLPAPVYLFLPSMEKWPYRSIWRLEKDGYTLNQIAHEEKQVDFFDVAPDGRLVYISNNNLIIADKDGNNRRILIAGKEPLLKGSGEDQIVLFGDYEEISSPVWSPNGKLIAYYRNGINLLEVSTGKSTQILEGPKATTNEAGVMVPADRVAPRDFPIGWTPDGSRIIVRVVRYEEWSMAFILPVAGAEKVDVDVPRGGCCDYSFTRDGQILFSSGNYTNIGLWRVDPQTGKGTNLTVQTNAKGEPGPLVMNPWQAPDGRIFFYTTASGNVEEVGWLKLAYVSSRHDTFRIPEDITFIGDENISGERLWLPDASRVIVEVNSNQLVIIETTSGKVTPLGLQGYSLHWGVK